MGYNSVQRTKKIHPIGDHKEKVFMLTPTVALQYEIFELFFSGEEFYRLNYIKKIIRKCLLGMNSRLYIVRVEKKT